MTDTTDWQDLLERLSEPFVDHEVKYRAGATNRDKTKDAVLVVNPSRSLD